MRRGATSQPKTSSLPTPSCRLSEITNSSNFYIISDVVILTDKGRSPLSKQIIFRRIMKIYIEAITDQRTRRSGKSQLVKIPNFTLFCLKALFAGTCFICSPFLPNTGKRAPRCKQVNRANSGSHKICSSTIQKDMSEGQKVALKN